MCNIYISNVWHTFSLIKVYTNIYVYLYCVCVCVLECRLEMCKGLKRVQVRWWGSRRRRSSFLERSETYGRPLLQAMAAVWAWWLFQARWQCEQWQEEGSYMGKLQVVSFGWQCRGLWQGRRGCGGRWGLGNASWDQIIETLSGSFFFRKLRFLRRENRIVYTKRNIDSAGRD